MPNRTAPKAERDPARYLSTCEQLSPDRARPPASPPTEKVNTPWTTWVSAEVTRQATVYVPGPRRCGIVTAIVSATGCATIPESTRLPAASYTPSDGTLTPSS